MLYDDDSETDGLTPEAENGVAPDGGIRSIDLEPLAAPPGSAGGSLPAGSPNGDLEHHRARNGHRDQADLARSERLEEHRVLEIQSSWNGPLPPPEIFAQYEAVLPGAADRILAMTEKVATGHIDNETKLISAEIESARTGLAIASVLTLIAMSAAIAFFAMGNALAGAAFISFPVVMMIRSFFNRSGSSKEPEESEPKKDK